MWIDQDADEDFEERISYQPSAPSKPRKQSYPRVNPDPTLNLTFKLSFIKEALGEEGYAKGMRIWKFSYLVNSTEFIRSNDPQSASWKATQIRCSS